MFFFFKQKTAYEVLRSLVGSEMCIRDRVSIAVVMVVMVGGAATFWGPIVGALIMVFLAEVIRSLPHIGAAHQTIFGIILILIIMFLPNGVVGDFGKLLKPFVGRRTSS